MHKFELRPELIEMVRRRRANIHPFENFTPETTALIVVDMQNFFVADGHLGAVATAREIVPNINAIADGLRSAGGKVVWLVTAFDQATAVEWSTFFDHFNSPEMRKGVLAGLKKDSDGYALNPELNVRDEDIIIEKDRFSAFIQGSSDIHEQMQKRNIDTLLITGTVTNVCCESTARDASMLNYKTVMVADGNAASSDVSHNATLNSLYGGFCDVLTTEAILARLAEVGGSKAQAAE